MAKSIRKNYLYNVSYQVLLIIVPLVTTPYVSRVLGADGVGTCSYIRSIAQNFMMLAVLGTMRYGQREISYRSEDPHGRSVVFFETFLIRIVTSILSCIAYFAFLRITDNFTVIATIFSLTILSVAVDVSWFFQGLEEFGKVVGRNFAFKILNIIFIFAFVKTHDDLTIYVLGTCALAFIGNLSLIPFLKRYLVPVKPSDLHPLSCMPTVLSLFIPSIAIAVYTILDKTMIGMITKDAFQNGYYEQSQKIVTIALTLVTSLGTVMISRIGSLYAADRSDDVRAYMYKSFRFVWFLGLPLAFGVAASATNLVPWFFGEGYEGVIPLLWVFSIQIVAMGMNNVTGVQYLVPTGRQNLLSASVIIGALVNLSMNLYLIPKIGALGATIASVTTESVIAITQLIMVRKEMEVGRILKSSAPYLLSGIVMFAVLNFVTNHLAPSPLGTVILILTGIVTYAGMLALLRDEMLFDVIQSAMRFARHSRP